MAPSSGKGSLHQVGPGMDQRGRNPKAAPSIWARSSMADGGDPASHSTDITYIGGVYSGVLFALLIAVPCWCLLIGGLMWWLR